MATISAATAIAAISGDQSVSPVASKPGVPVEVKTPVRNFLAYEISAFIGVDMLSLLYSFILAYQKLVAISLPMDLHLVSYYLGSATRIGDIEPGWAYVVGGG
jgi:hypothetical protein